ncbi:MAG: hypothetical protein WB245_02600, partial [Acidimicrobiia bacterium]
LAALAPTFNLLLLARLVQGIGSSGLVNLAVVLIGDHWSGVERTRLVGRNSAVLTIGLAGLPLLRCDDRSFRLARHLRHIHPRPDHRGSVVAGARLVATGATPDTSRSGR